MKAGVIMDTGPLVAALRNDDGYHQWALETLGQLHPPFITCEPVLAECCFLMRKTSVGFDPVLSLVEQRIVEVKLAMQAEIERIRGLSRRYASRPMSLADACLVRMAELFPAFPIMTVDRDFEIYRQHDHQPIKLISPHG